MRIAYLDTSCLVAIAFGEPGGADLAGLLHGYTVLASANLLEAEFRAALRRESVEHDGGYLEGITWVLPDRPLQPEIERALGAHYLRGADLWHVATALFLADDPGDVDFLTLDADQRRAASELGFGTVV